MAIDSSSRNSLFQFRSYFLTIGWYRSSVRKAISPDVQLESFAAEEVKISEEFMVLIRRKLRKKNRRLEGLSRAERDVLAVTMDKKLRRDEILTWVSNLPLRIAIPTYSSALTIPNCF